VLNVTILLNHDPLRPNNKQPSDIYLLGHDCPGCGVDNFKMMKKTKEEILKGHTGHAHGLMHATVYDAMEEYKNQSTANLIKALEEVLICEYAPSYLRTICKVALKEVEDGK